MTKRTRAAGCGVVVLMIGIVAGCQRERERRPPTPLDRATLGTITGTVRFTGTPPPQTELDMSSSKDCAAQHSGPVAAADVLVKDGKVQNVIVAIKDGLGDRVFAVSETPVEIDQQGCMFVPRVSVAQVGQPLRFLNSDTFPHNVRAAPPKASGWNFSLGLKGAARTIDVDQPLGVVPIKCDIHPWMAAYLGIYDHPFAAVTDADGEFTLRDIPAGTYVVEAWHERFGTRTATAIVVAKEAASVSVTFDGK
jgi:plastocyanin